MKDPVYLSSSTSRAHRDRRAVPSSPADNHHSGFLGAPLRFEKEEDAARLAEVVRGARQACAPVPPTARC